MDFVQMIADLVVVILGFKVWNIYMSYNQVRTDKIDDGQLRNSGGLGRGFSRGGRGGGRSGGGGGVAASLSTNQSNKKSSNGQRWQPRMVRSNLGSETSVPSATLRAVQNGAPGPPYSQGSSTLFVSSELSNPTGTSLPKPSQALPEISSQSSPAASDSASPSTPIKGLQVMHKTERKYEVGKVSDEEEAKQRQLKGILNKLTPQNFYRLIQKVKDVNIDNAVTLTGVVSQIFDRALMEPTFCELYSNFCFHLSYELPDFMENGEKITFKRLLLNKCQEEFERGEREEAEAKRVEDEGEIKQTDEEKEEKRIKARRRMLGNICLIGELYKKKMLTERVMHECIQKLLGEHQTPDEEDLEALCKLMSTIGYHIDHAKARNFMDSYFESMLKLSTNNNLSSRIRFMLRDIIDLRKNRWQQRRKVEGPKKIEEVHRDAAQERQSQTSRLTREPIRQGSSGRAGSIVKSDRFTNAVQRCYDLLASIIAIQRWELMLIFRNEPSNLDIVETLGDQDVEGFIMYELDLLHRQ